jgi:hypothetical protein
MTRGRLMFAEECADRQVRTELFRGREFELVTGRVILHAADAGGLVLCGHDAGSLTPSGRPWDAGYLPHLARCPACAARAGDGPPGPARPADAVDLRTAHGTDREQAAAAALRAVLATHDLRRWLFTDQVTVDETIRGGFSHPLTLSPGLLVTRPARALTTFLHEQLHWLEGPGTDSAVAEASQRWPDPPAAPAGAADRQSTWLHLSVCALEYVSLSELTGPAAAAAELEQHAGYAWIYGQILADPGWFSGFLARHGLRVPSQPPLPRRYFGPPWWTAAGQGS